jgi:hypothetical protein
MAEAKRKAKPAPPPPKPLPAEYANSVCIIEGSRKTGTGFIATFKGKTVLVTNQHVVFGEKTLRVRNAQGNEFKANGGVMASDADAVLLFVEGELPEGVKPFIFSENVGATAKAGDLVTITGNPRGTGTLTTAEGRVKALGPSLVEHDVPTFQGNSGSPIFHQASGQVIGIHTEAYNALSEDVTEAEQAAARNTRSPIPESGIRRLGARIDTEKAWAPLDWNAMNAASRELDKIKAALKDAQVLCEQGRPTLIKDKILRQRFEEAHKKLNAGSDTEAYNMFIKGVESSRTSIQFKLRQSEPLMRSYFHRKTFREYQLHGSAAGAALEVMEKDYSLGRAMFAGKYKMPEKVRAVFYRGGTFWVP